LEIYDHYLRTMPLWLVFMFTVIVVLISVYIGYRIGRYARGRSKDDTQFSTGSVVAASLALLAFMLAFTFGIAANRFNARKQLVLDEVNTIGTTYLRADFLPEPERTKVKRDLRDYVDLRASIARKDVLTKPDKIQEIIDNAESMQNEIWVYTLKAGRQHPDSEVVGLFISSLNTMIDLHTQRVVVALQYQILGAVWGALYLLSVLTFGLVGFELGASGGGSVLVSIIIALVFSTVILLITDLDRPLQGQVLVSQQPMIELQQKLREEVP
jgi:hypothetical protein